MGIFLFILFFQPFPGQFSDVNSILIFAAGFGAIVFLLLYLINLIPSSFRDQENDALSYFNGFILLIISSTAFCFYLRYVGQATITFYVAFKIVLICLVPPSFLRFYTLRNASLQENNMLQKEIAILQEKIDRIEESNQLRTIEFASDNISESSRFLLRDIALIKSADNYVEIFYLEEHLLKKKMLRNTLRRIELQLRPFAGFLRCHRTCIVNVAFVERLNRKFNTHWLVIKNFQEQIPVSRQYLLRLKEAIARG